MKKKILSIMLGLILVLSAFVGTSIMANATDGLDNITVDEVWNGTWSASVTDKYAYLTVDKTGYYDITIEDLNNTGVFEFELVDLDLEDSDDIYSSCYNTAVHLSSQYTGLSESNVYLIEDHLYEIHMRYGYYDYDYNFIGLSANVNVTVSSTDYQPLDMTLGQYKNLTVSNNTTDWLVFKTTTAADYLIETNQTAWMTLAIYEKSAGKWVATAYYSDYTAKRVKLKANTEYIMIVYGEEESSKLVRLKVSKATTNVTKVEVAQGDTYILANNGYSMNDSGYLYWDTITSLDYKITYSDKSTETLSYYECQYAGISINDICYIGEFCDHDGEDALQYGTQSVEIDYMNDQKSASTIYVSTYLERFSYLNTMTDYDDMYIEYDGDGYYTYYWKLKPDETNNYQFYSSDWDQISTWTTIFDEDNNVVEYVDGGYNLKGGKEYCLRIEYCYEDGCYDDVKFWLEPHRDHVHDISDTEIVKATLSKNGALNNVCSICGYVDSSTTIYSPKTFKLSATSYTCDGKVKTPTVTVKDSKGNTLKNGTDYTVKYESGRKAVGKYTVTITFKGKYSGTKKLEFSINGLKKVNGTWCYVKNGEVAKTYTGLVKHTDGKFYYVKSGVKTSFNGLVKYNGKWYYVKSGVVNTSYTGLVKHTDGKFYYVKNGVKTSFNGLVKYNSKWYYVKDGVVNTSYTGLVKHTDGKWYYVKKGVKTSYTGTVTYNGKKYKVKNGVKV